MPHVSQQRGLREGSKIHNCDPFHDGKKLRDAHDVSFSQMRRLTSPIILFECDVERNKKWQNYTTTSFMMFPMLLERSGMRT